MVQPTSSPLTPHARAARVRLAVFDVDGVLTDGRLYFGNDGEAMKAFDVRDGHGLKLLQRAGVRVALLTARTSGIVATRAQELGVDRLMQGQRDKLAAFETLVDEMNVTPEACAYMGDDWPDLPVLRAVGFAAAPADACAEVQAAAVWISTHSGGRGAVREFAEFVLRAQDRYDALLEAHLSAGAHA